MLGFRITLVLFAAAVLLSTAAPLHARQATSPGGKTEVGAPAGLRGAITGDAGFWRLLGWRLERELSRIAPAAPGRADAPVLAGGDPARALSRRIEIARAARRTHRAAAADGTSGTRRRQPAPDPIDAALDRLSHTLRWTAVDGTGGARRWRLQGRLWLAIDDLGRLLDREEPATENGIVTAPLVGTGTIAGTVTDDVTGAPLADVSLNIFDEDHLYVQGSSASGTYSVPNLPAGTYYARAFSNTHIQEMYDDVSCVPTCSVEDATPIVVSAGATTPGIDFALHRGGSITGSVTEDGTGDPLSDVLIIVRDANSGIRAITTTLADGTYTAGGLPTGTYYAETHSDTHADELYDDAPCTSSCDTSDGTPISVTVGVTTPGIDFALSPAGSVAGTITDAVTGQPLADVHVNVRDTSGNTISAGVSGSDGTYVVTGVPTATVYALAHDETYVDELYDDVPCFTFCDVSTGTPISVTAPLTTAGIDFQLSTGGSFAGTLTDAATGDPLFLKNVLAYDASGSFVDAGYAESDGGYAITGLPTGSYFARTDTDSHLEEVFDDLPYRSSADVTAGTPISVYADGITPGIDFALEIGGTISGTVIDATTFAALSGVFVRIDDSSGAIAAIADAGSQGTYVSPPLRSGTYYARIYSSTTHYGELYDELPFSDDSTTGTPIPVVNAAVTTGIDFTLDPKVAGCTGPEILDLSAQTIDSTVIFTACHSIRAGSGFIVGDGGDVTLRAGGSIILEDGFSVASGGRLTVEPDATFP